MSRYIHKSHNVSVLLYHVVFPAKYRRVVFSATVDEKLKETCLEISKRSTFCTISADVQCEEDSADHQKHHGARDFRLVSRGEEEAMGRGVLVGRILRQY